MFILSRAQVLVIWLLISLFARGTVILIWNPHPVGMAPLVYGKTFWAAGVEFQPHIGDFIRLSYQRKRRTR